LFNYMCVTLKHAHAFVKLIKKCPNVLCIFSVIYNNLLNLCTELKSVQYSTLFRCQIVPVFVVVVVVVVVVAFIFEMFFRSPVRCITILSSELFFQQF
jgi:hypothetical protein